MIWSTTYVLLNYPKDTARGNSEARLQLKKVQGEQSYYRSQILTQLAFNTMYKSQSKIFMKQACLKKCSILNPLPFDLPLVM